MSDDKPVHRRGFFRQGLLQLLKPIAQAIEPIERAAAQLERLDSPPPAAWLRPPGALDEPLFKETCSRSGNCTRVCPANCIKIDRTGNKGDGAPYVDANNLACVVCTSLACMQACPSGALVPTPAVEIDMGTALWHEDRCVRTAGAECTVCVEVCPMGEKAIHTNGRRIEVNPDACVGCGLCQQHCPTKPKSIEVIPRGHPRKSNHR
jgi:ferredoxin-type protein NapG